MYMKSIADRNDDRSRRGFLACAC